MMSSSINTSRHALRRRRNDLAKNHAKEVVLHIWKSPALLENNWAIKNADHLKSCSCEMCRNPRRSKSKEKTRKELEKEPE